MLINSRPVINFNENAYHRYNVSRYGLAASERPKAGLSLVKNSNANAVPLKNLPPQPYRKPLDANDKSFYFANNNRIVNKEADLVDARPSPSVIRTTHSSPDQALSKPFKPMRTASTRKPIKIVEIPAFPSTMKSTTTKSTTSRPSTRQTTTIKIESVDESPIHTSSAKPELVDTSRTHQTASSNAAHAHANTHANTFDAHIGSQAGINFTFMDNRTDHTILNHILSLIAGNESPPDVKVFTKPTGIAYSTHVEVHQVHHHRIAKREAHHDGTDHDHRGHADRGGHANHAKHEKNENVANQKLNATLNANGANSHSRNAKLEVLALMMSILVARLAIC